MTDEYRELLLGCGRRRDKRVHVPGLPQRPWQNLTTLDWDVSVKPDIRCDLNAMTPWFGWVGDQEPRFDTPLPQPPLAGRCRGIQAGWIAREFVSDYWDEIHAYEVLEHLGQQGDAHSFLAHFGEIWRLLKPNGYLCATVPSWHSRWLWADPSHRRAILPESLVFLDQEQYALQCDGPNPTPMSDFRTSCGYTADFRLIDSHDDRRATFTFILQAVKPSRRRV